MFCVDTTLLRSVMVTDVKMTSASISYSTFQGCSYFPNNTIIQLHIVNVNTSNFISMNSKKYLVNSTDFFELTSLNASTIYKYTIQVFVSDNINNGMKISSNIIGQFMTRDTEEKTSTSKY